MRLYVASSWRNLYQPRVVNYLRLAGHDVYDFKNPPNRTGFSWAEISANWENWTTEQYQKALEHRLADDGFKSDFDAMCWAEACVLVLPCGRSAHSEAGWMKGAGKPVYVLIPTPQEPELMYKLYDGIFTEVEKVSLCLHL